MEVDKSSSISPKSEKTKLGTACNTCRKAKLKCTRRLNQNACDKCLRSGRECIVVPSKLGRKVGSKNKFTDLNRSLQGLDPDTIQEILKSYQEGTKSIKTDMSTPSSSDADNKQNQSPSSVGPLEQNSKERSLSPTSLAQKYKDMTNPLGLLSQICTDTKETENAITPNGHRYSNHVDNVSTLDNQDPAFCKFKLNINVSEDWLKEGYDYIFSDKWDNNVDKPFSYFEQRLRYYSEATDPELDPITAGMVTEEEVEQLFEFYYKYLGSTCFELDPKLCTPMFVRRTSTFLLTAVCYTASLFAPFSNAAMTKRLHTHYEKTAYKIIEKQYKSASIIHAFIIGVGHKSPSKYVAEENAWTFFCHAHSIAEQIGIHTLWETDEASFPFRGWNAELSRHQVEPDTEQASYLRKHIERSYLHLYAWGTGLAHSLDLPWKIKCSDISTKRLLGWHNEPYTMQGDYSATRIALLRKEFCTLKTMIDSQQYTYEEMNDKVDSCLNKWDSEQLQPLLHEDGTIPRSPVYLPFVILMFRTTRVVLKSLLIKLCGDVRQSLASTCCCFVSAAKVVELTVSELHDGASLRYMPNNVSICILYSAVWILKFGSYLKFEKPDVNIKIISLLGQLSRQLDIAGSTPPHRNGIPKLFGRYLRAILITSAEDFNAKEQAAKHLPETQSQNTFGVQQTNQEDTNVWNYDTMESLQDLDHWVPFESANPEYANNFTGLNDSLLGNLLNYIPDPFPENGQELLSHIG